MTIGRWDARMQSTRRYSTMRLCHHHIRSTTPWCSARLLQIMTELLVDKNFRITTTSGIGFSEINKIGSANTVTEVRTFVWRRQAAPVFAKHGSVNVVRVGVVVLNHLSETNHRFTTPFVQRQTGCCSSTETRCYCEERRYKVESCLTHINCTEQTTSGTCQIRHRVECRRCAAGRGKNHLFCGKCCHKRAAERHSGTAQLLMWVTKQTLSLQRPV